MKAHSVGSFRWAVLGIATFAYFQLSFHRVGPASLIPYLTEDLEISNALAGALISAYFIPYMLLQVPSGQVADRYGVKWLVPPALFVISVSSLSFSFALNYSQSFMSRVLMGVAAAFIFPPAVKSIISHFSTEERAKGIGFYVTGGFAGASVGLAVMPLLATFFGWRLGYALTSVMTFAAVIVSALVLRRGAKMLASPTDLQTRSLSQEDKPSLHNVLKNPYVIMGGLVDLTIFGTAIGLATWTYSYAVRELGVPLAEAGLIPSAFTIGTGVAQVLVGFVSDKMGRRKPFLVGALALGSLCVLLFTFTQNMFLIYIIASLTGGSIGVGMVMVFSLVSEQVRRKDAGGAVGFVNMLAAIGPVVTPYVAGFLLDATGSFHIVFIFLAMLLSSGLVISLFEEEGNEVVARVRT